MSKMMCHEPHQAQAVFTLGNTLFVNRMVGSQPCCRWTKSCFLLFFCLKRLISPPGSKVSGSRHQNSHQRVQRAVGDTAHRLGRHQPHAPGPAGGALPTGRPGTQVGVDIPVRLERSPTVLTRWTRLGIVQQHNNEQSVVLQVRQ